MLSRESIMIICAIITISIGTTIMYMNKNTAKVTAARLKREIIHKEKTGQISRLQALIEH